MSRNGTGTYNLPVGNPVVSGTPIASAWANTTLSDIASALTGSVAADGQTPMTGALDMTVHKILNVAPATAAGNAVEYAQFVAATSTAVDITGGTINGTTIGVTTPAVGRFTTLEATGNVTFVGGTINGTSIGATTASTGAFTNFTASGTASFTSTGAVKVPVGTTAQQPTPVTGMIRYNSSNAQFEGYYASTWNQLGGGATGGGGNQVFVLNDQTVTVSYTIPTGKNASSAGPITIDTGVTVTVPTDSTWVIV